MRRSISDWRLAIPSTTLLAAGLVAFAWLFAGVEHAKAQRKQPDAETPSKEVTDQICTVVKSSQSVDPMDPIQLNRCNIQEITSATGDDAKTILVDIGGMGASTDAIEIYRMEGGKVVYAKFRDNKGVVSDGGLFLQGASVMHLSNVMLSPKQHAIFSIEEAGTRRDGTWDSCEVHAYEWAPKVKMYVERAPKPTDEVRCKVRRRKATTSSSH